MSSFDEPQTGAGPQQEESPAAEPRLLTRTESPTSLPRQRPRQHRQHAAETGLGAWSKRLSSRRASKPKRPPIFAGTPGTTGRPRTQRKDRRRLWRRLALLATALLLLAAVGTALYLRHAVGTALPEVDGSVHAAGLRAPVTVARNSQGVPVITASNLPDLLFAQGYTTAGDRLWQMDGLRRHAAGELAAILGPGFLDHDRHQRILQLRAVADRAVQQLPPDQLAQLQAYAAGVNSYISSHGNALPPEFRLLAYSPAPWTPRDSLLVWLAMWQDLSTSFPRQLDREALRAHLPSNLLADLYPVGSWRDVPPAAQGRDLTAPHVVEQIPLDPSQSRIAVPALPGEVEPHQLATLTAELMGGGRCDGCRSGSNNWVVSGARSSTGAPMLANDMHLSLGIPDIWYEASLHSPLSAAADGAERLDVTGFSLPGVPLIIVGRNAHVAWGVTNLGADVQDLRVEHLRGSGDTSEYQQQDGSWTAVGHHTETISVRGRLSARVDVQTTVHPGAHGPMETPLISALYPGETRALSLSWTAYESHGINLPFLAGNAATDGATLVAALQHFGGPTLNLVWADSEGHIGYHALGEVPVRGPAVQHPRAVQAPIAIPGSTPLPADGAGDVGVGTGDYGEGPQASNHELQLAPGVHPADLAGAGPHLLLIAYQRPSRRRRALHPPMARQSHPPAVRRRRPERATPSAPATAPELTVAPAPAPIDYTIGSPLSPVPTDALDPTQAWTAEVPFEALPAVTDPKNGFLATANARITPDDYPYYVSDDWADPFRAERIVHLLAGRKALTPADMLHMETDVHSDVNQMLAQRLAYAVDHADLTRPGMDGKRLREAANLLRAWDGDMTVTSAPAAIVAAARKALWPALLVPQIRAHDHVDNAHATALSELYSYGERTTALELLIQHEPARWLPAGFQRWNDFLAATLSAALREASAPGNLAHWQYGEGHRVELVHPLFGKYPLVSRLLGVRASTGAKPAPGDGTTLDAIGSHFGPSERFVADLSSSEGGLANLTTGESGNPRSPWYLDQFRPWLEGWSFALPTGQTGTAHTLTLLP